MGREPKFLGTIAYSSQPIAGVTLYTDRKSELSIEEMLEELEKDEIRGTRKDLLLSKLRERMGITVKGVPSTQPNPKRYLVDPETGRIEINEEEGELTYKDAIMVSASIKGKSGDYDGAINLIKAAKELAGDTKKSAEEKPKEFYVDDEGIIHHDPENGELTLSEARSLSQSRQKPSSPPTGFYIDSQGQRHDLAPGQPAIIERQGPAPPSYFVNQRGEMQEIKPGQPIVIKMESDRPPSTPIALKDKDGNPMVLDIASLISYKKFESEEKRLDESHRTKEEMAGAFKDFLGKISAAAQRMASR